MATNAEVVRSIYAAWALGDYSCADWADSAIEFVHVDGPSPHTWSGAGSLAEGTRAWIDVWEDMTVEAEECRDLDDSRVLALTRYSGRAKASGVELDRIGGDGATIFYLREGKVVRIEQYFHRARAFADLGDDL